MAKTIATVNVATDTFQVLIAQVNSVIDVISAEAVTANNNANGALTTGNAYVNGTMSAVTFAANTIRGGNVQSSQSLRVSSNLDITGDSVTVGNSTINVVANSTTLKISNSSAAISITNPSAAEIVAGNFALLSNGNWSRVLTSPNSEFHIAANVYFTQNVQFNTNTTTTFNSNVIFANTVTANNIDLTTANIGGSVISGNSTHIYLNSELTVNGTIYYENFSVNNYTLYTNSTGVDIPDKLWVNDLSVGPNTTALPDIRVVISDGDVQMHSSDSNTGAAVYFSTSEGTRGLVGFTAADRDAFMIYGPNSAYTGIEIAAKYTQNAWTLYAAALQRLQVNTSGISVTGNLIVSASSNVTGPATFSNSITVNSTALVHGRLYADEGITINSQSPTHTAHKFAIVDGEAYIAASNASYHSRMIFARENTGATSWIGIHGTNPDALQIHGPTASNSELAAIYETSVWRFLTAGIERLRIGATGNVGIGITNPTSKLHVSGTTTLAGNTNISGILTAGDSSFGSVISGNTTIDGVLSTSGAATLASASISGTLNVDGNTSLLTTTINNILNVGINDTTQGAINIYGGSEIGPALSLYQPADSDGTIERTYIAADAGYVMIQHQLTAGGEVDGFRMYGGGNVQLARTNGEVEIGSANNVRGMLEIAGSAVLGGALRWHQSTDDNANNAYIQATADQGGLIFNRADGNNILQLYEDRTICLAGYASNPGVLTVDNDGDLVQNDFATAPEYRQNAGNGVLTTPIVWDAMAEVTLSDDVSIAWDMDTGIDFVVTLAGNRTLANPTNVTVGKKGRLRVVQDATGSRTLSFGTNYEFAGGSAVTLSSGANDQDVLYYDCISATRILISAIQDIF